MRSEFSKRHATMCLVGEGFAIEEITPVVGERRADLRAKWCQEEYIVEAKLRGESRSWRALARQARNHGFASETRDVEPWNAISTSIRRAYEQLVATPAGQDAFRILWIVALHDDDKFVIECVERRLFGLQSVVVVKSVREQPEVMPCYYYSFADFRRFRDLDAAVLSTRVGGWLCVNSFSPGKESFRKNRLYQRLDGHGAVRDPEILEQRGAALLIGDDFTADPSGREQWSYLRMKYGVRTSVMRETMFNGLVSVPLDGSERYS